MTYIEKLKNKIQSMDGEAVIQLQGDREFSVKPIVVDEFIAGVEVDNLSDTYKFITIDAFLATISLLSLSIDQKAKKGTAIGFKLGDSELPLNSVEGHIANVIYGKEVGNSVFKRITPISKILEWAGICENGKGFLALLPLVED